MKIFLMVMIFVGGALAVSVVRHGISNFFDSKPEMPEVVGLIPDTMLIPEPFRAIQKGEEEHFFHAPCPIDPALEKIIFESIIPMGSGQNERRFEDVVHKAEMFKTAENMLRRMKDLLIIHDKLNHQGSGLILGASGAGDMEQAVGMAIAEHLLLFHTRVEGGLFPGVEVFETSEKKITLTLKERALFQKIYAACHPMMSPRLEGGFFAHVFFLPTAEESKEIHHTLGFAPDTPDVVICTYKNTDDVEKK